jgi:DNA-binding transcriptional MerR regulator
MVEHLQIGAVAERTGLSLRTIRHYEDVGLVVPSARSAGGFRLYTDDDVARFRVIMRMKPLDFTLEQMGDLLGLLDGLATEADPARRDDLAQRLAAYRVAVDERVQRLRTRLAVAEEFARELADADPHVT